MTLEVYKIDESPTRSLILIKDTNDNKFYPGNGSIISPVTVYTGSTGISGSGGNLGPDLTAIEALTGTGVWYYRSAADTWTPVTVGSGLRFSGGTLSYTGLTGSPLDGDLIALAALNGTNTIYYRSATDTWSAVTIGSGLQFVGGILSYTGLTGSPLDEDLIALAAVNGTNTIYYRSAANTWSPVTIGSGLSFVGGTLSFTGTTGSNTIIISGSGSGTLDADLTSLAEATGTNAIYYRSSVNTWSPLTLSPGISINNGYLIAEKETYDLENDIGIIPNIYTTPVLTNNTTKLNSALDAMCPTGQFTFTNGTLGPILKPISCQGKTFYFNGNLKTNTKGGGELKGVGGGAFPVGDGEIGSSAQGGSMTRFVRVGAQGTEGEFAFLIRNNGFTLENISLHGNQSPGNINTFTGNRIHTLLGIEGRATPAVGQHKIRNCSLAYGQYGIRLLNGYYDETGGFNADENHSDLTYWECVTATQVNTAWRSHSQQAIWHQLDRCYFLPDSGGVVFDVLAGGTYTATALGLGPVACTVLQVSGYSPNNARFDLEVFKDGWPGADNAQSGFCLFKYKNNTLAGATYMDWDVRFRGAINTWTEAYYMSGLAQFNGVTGSRVWFDMNNIQFAPAPPHYQWATYGPWRRLEYTG